MSKKFDAQRRRINKAVVRLEQEFGQAPTQYRQIIGQAPIYFIDRGKRRGQIRTWTEVKKELLKNPHGKEMLDRRVFTRERYEKEVTNILAPLGKRITYSGEKKFQFTRMRDLLKEQGISYGKLTNEQLLTAFRNAEQRERQLRYNTSYDSTNRINGWYALLEEEIQKMKNV